MTKVTILVRDGKRLGFIASQHAGEDEVGEIVCHGVSALTLTALLAIHKLTGLSEDAMGAEQAEAYLSMRIPTGAVSETTETIFQTMEIGLFAIREEYGNYITIETQEV